MTICGTDYPLMQTVYKRFSVITGFVVLLIVLIANTAVMRRQLGVQIESQNWVTHTREVLLELDQTELLLTDAETGQRGFLYTGDPKYLAPYGLAISNVEAQLDVLQRLTADNQNQQTRLSELRGLVEDKSKELRQTIELYEADKPDEAKALVLSDAGLIQMNAIRKTIGEMTGEEENLQTSRSAAYRESVKLTIACIYLASLLAAIGLILLAYYILREMQLRERHAALTAEREEWFRVTLTSLGDGVIATDEYGVVTFLNPIAEQLTGRTMEASKGRPIVEIFPIFNESTHEPVENPVKKVMELGRIVGLANHTVLKKTDGTLIAIEDSAAPIRGSDGELVGVVLVFRDATFERKSQEMLRKSEKLAAAARLASTVAHEINNPLEAVGNLIYIAKGTPGMPEEAASHLALAEQELERVSHITRQTLGFYRETNFPGQVDVPALVETVLRLYANKFRTKNITIERKFGECPPIQGLAGELKQAVSNLISNAADAVDINGTIRLTLECIESNEGKVIQVLIEDDGPGISAENIDRIFEPFFTTKQDVGTGLGLWVTKEIINRHGGSIVIQAADEGSSGAAFHVLLPVVEHAGSGDDLPN
jgi:PAS domain S-box-containing protein